MRVLVACEFSCTVRNAFLRMGHDAYSCDLLPSRFDIFPKRHYVGDVIPHLKRKWDLVIAHPPCTFLCKGGERWASRKKRDKVWENWIMGMNAGLDFWRHV